MLRSRLFTWSGLLAVVTGLLVPLAAHAQLAVVSARSLDAMQATSRYVAREAGPDTPFGKLETVLKPILGAKNIGGLDTRRPFGAYVLSPEKPGNLEDAVFPIVYFVPVADEKRFVALLEEVSWRPRKMEDGSYRLTVPIAGEHFFCFANGHAYASTTQAALRGKLPEPATFLPDGGPRSVVTASLRIAPCAKEYAQLLKGSVAAFRRLVAKDDKEAQMVSKMLEAQEHIWRGSIDQLETVRMTLEADPEQHQLVSELVAVPRAATSERPRPGKDLSDFCQYAAMARSRFAPMSRAAPIGAFLHFPPLAEEGKRPVPVPDMLMKDWERFVERRYRPFLKLVPIFAKVLQVDGLDCCLIQKGNSVLFGLNVFNGRQIDHTLRDVLQELPTEVKDDYAVEWNHSRHGSARIHKVNRWLGEKVDDMQYVGIREDVIVWSDLQVVKDSLTELDKAVDRLPTPLFEMTFSSAGLFEDKDIAEAAKKELSTTERDRLRLRITLQGGKDLRLRIEGSTWLLKGARSYLPWEGK
jgi:hypothetical protein